MCCIYYVNYFVTEHDIVQKSTRQCIFCCFDGLEYWSLMGFEANKLCMKE